MQHNQLLNLVHTTTQLETREHQMDQQMEDQVVTQWQSPRVLERLVPTMPIRGHVLWQWGMI